MLWIVPTRSPARADFSRNPSIAFQQYPHPAYDRALDYAVLGEKENAFASLEEAYRNHDLDVLSLLSSPNWIHSDPTPATWTSRSASACRRRVV